MGCSELQWVAVSCSGLQWVVCSVLQWAAVVAVGWGAVEGFCGGNHGAVCYIVLPYVAMYCHVLPCVAVCCRRRCSSGVCSVGGFAQRYGVAAIFRPLKIIGLFCRISSLLQGSFAKKTYNFKEPTTCSHPIVILNSSLASAGLGFRV